MVSTSEGGHPPVAINCARFAGGRCLIRLRIAAALIAVATAGAFVQIARAQTLTSDEVLSSVSVGIVAAPDPVLGADNRIHLAYELIVSNTTTLFIRLDKVEAVEQHGNVLGSLSGAPLAAMVTMHGGSGTTMAPGGSAIVFMDTSFAAGAVLPPAIGPRITVTRQLAGPDGKPAPFPASEPLPATVSFTGPFAPIGKTPAVTIDPPLRGPRWVAANGCCDTLTSHRGAVMAVNGVQRTPERFAIDWLQLRPDDRLYSGGRSELESYAYFGTPVYAVADGTVVNLYDKAVEQVPGEPAKGITPESIGGNMLVIDIGGGNFAFFAHLKPGSLRVKLGDRVKRGEVIALLGNTGNTDAPHLHFHVMDGKSPLDANGKPYVFTHFVGQGVLDDASGEALFLDGKPGVIKPSPMDGNHRDELPLNDEVVDFGN
jgi:hypothetical protein